MPSQYQALIFDLDNTLVTSQLDFALIRQSIDCPQGQDIIAYLDTLPAAERQHKESIVYEFEMREAQQAQAFPGAVELLSSLQRMSVPYGIVTRNCRDAAQRKLDITNLQVGTLIAREDAPAKPDPSALLMLAKTWQMQPQQMAYVGDFRYDLEAARNAGMAGILLWPDIQKTPEYAEMADHVIEHLDELNSLISAR